MSTAPSITCPQCGALLPAASGPSACGYCGAPIAAPPPPEGCVWLTDDAVLAHLRSNVTGLDATYLDPGIPPKKLGNVRKIHAATLPANERVLALYDGTAFGSAKDGFVVTSRRLLWKNQMEGVHFLEWHHIDPDTVFTDGSKLVVGEARIETLYGRDDEALWTWAMLLETLARSARPSAEAEAEAAASSDDMDHAPSGWGDASVAVAAAHSAGGWGGTGSEPHVPPPSAMPGGISDVECLARPPYDESSGCSIVDVVPGGHYFVTAGHGTVELRAAGDGSRCVAFAAPDSVLAARVSPDGRWLVLGATDQRAHLYELATGHHRGSTPELSDYCDDVQWLGDSSRFVAASQTGEITIFDATTMQAERRLLAADGDYAQLGGLAVTADGRRVFASVGERLGAFDTESGRILWRVDEAMTNPSRLATSAGGETVLAAGYDGVAIFDGATGRARARYHFNCYAGVSWPEASNGGLLRSLVGNAEAMTYSWSPRPSCSPQGDLVAVQDHVGNLVFIDVATGTPYPCARAEGRAWIEDVAWFQDNNHVVVGMSDGTAAIWSVRPMDLRLRCRVIDPLPDEAYERRDATYG